MYRVQFTDDGLADVKALPKNVRNFLRKEIGEKLARDPRGCSIELREPLRDWRSFSCQKYRVVFRVYDDRKVVAIAGVGKRLPQSRQDIYKKLERLAAEGRLAEKVLRTLRGFSSSVSSE